MKLIPPIEITASTLSASNVAISETAWTAGTYSLGDQRYVGTRLYEVVADPSTTDEPTAGAVADPPTWLDIGAINRFKMFDVVIGDVTEQSAANIDVTLDFDAVINSVALFNIVGSTVQIVVDDPTDGEVYNQTYSLNDNTGVNNWYQYFFAPISRKADLVVTDLPAYSTATIQVVVANGGLDTAVGEAVFGRSTTLGVTLMNFSLGIEDFSRKDRDQFGNFVITERRFSRLANYDVFVSNNQFVSSFNTLAQVRATPAVYIGDESKTETIVLGFYRDFSTLRTGPNSSEMTLEVEGLV